MYGFIEKWLADHLGVPYEPFVLNSGGEAALINVEDYNNVFMAIRAVSALDNDHRMPVRDVHADIVGTNTILHKYWCDDDVLDGLTGSAVKQDERYLAIMNLGRGTARFNLDWFRRTIGAEYDRIRRGTVGTGPATVAVLDAAPAPAEDVVFDGDEIEEEYGEEELRTANEVEAEVTLRDAGAQTLTPEEIARIAAAGSGSTGAIATPEPGTYTYTIPAEQITTQDGGAATPEQVEATPATVEAKSGKPVEQENPDSVAEPAKEPEPKVDPGVRFATSIMDGDFPGAIDWKPIKDTGRWIIWFGYARSLSFEVLEELSKTLDRNIVIVSEGGHANIIKILKRDYNIADIFKHTIFLSTYPERNQLLQLVDSTQSLCFGKSVRNVYLVRAGSRINERMSDIRTAGYDREEEERRIQEVIDEGGTSPFAKFDQVFKDTVTNVVWALRDRCFIYLTFNPDQQRNNLDFITLAFKELGRRLDGKLSYKELRAIDSEYHEGIASQYREQYIEFAVSNSQSVIKELKTQCNDARGKYRQHFDQAMEYAKLTQKYQDQIDAFDEEGFIAKEREKATKSYDETVGIDKVSAVYVKDNAVHVYTNNIYAQDERTKRWHDIGTFHITIGMLDNTYNQEKTVHIRNTKHQVYGMNEGMQAPHVFPQGYICHGNLATGMIEAYKRRDLFQLMMQIVLFLQTANTDDSAGRHVDKWPEVPEEVALRSEDDSGEEDAFAQISEAEKEWDSAVQGAIPIHV